MAWWPTFGGPFWIEMERRISRGEYFGKHYVEKGAVLHYTFEGSKPAKKKQRAMMQCGSLSKDDPFNLKTPEFTLDQAKQAWDFIVLQRRDCL